MKSSVTLTGMRAELLRRHFDLRRIETELKKLPKPIEPANCNVADCMRLMDAFDRTSYKCGILRPHNSHIQTPCISLTGFQLTRRCLQLHPAFVSVLNRLLKMGKPTCRDPAVLELQKRIYIKLQWFMVSTGHMDAT